MENKVNRSNSFNSIETKDKKKRNDTINVNVNINNNIYALDNLTLQEYSTDDFNFQISKERNNKIIDHLLSNMIKGSNKPNTQAKEVNKLANRNANSEIKGKSFSSIPIRKNFSTHFSGKIGTPKSQNKNDDTVLLTAKNNNHVNSYENILESINKNDVIEERKKENRRKCGYKSNVMIKDEEKIRKVERVDDILQELKSRSKPKNQLTIKSSVFRNSNENMKRKNNVNNVNNVKNRFSGAISKERKTLLKGVQYDDSSKNRNRGNNSNAYPLTTKACSANNLAMIVCLNCHENISIDLIGKILLSLNITLNNI